MVSETEEGANPADDTLSVILCRDHSYVTCLLDAPHAMPPSHRGSSCQADQHDRAKDQAFPGRRNLQVWLESCMELLACEVSKCFSSKLVADRRCLWTLDSGA